MQPRERPRSGSTDNRVVVESAGARTFRSVSRSVTLDPAPACPPAARNGFTASRRALRSDLTRDEEVFKRASVGLRLPTDLCNAMFDARARPRAVNPPPREAPASVRVGDGLRRPIPLPLHVPERKWKKKDPPPRSPARDVSIHDEFCRLVRWQATVRDRHDRVSFTWGPAREMTQGAMPSDDPLRVPLAGASPLSRRGRCAW